MEIFLIRHRIWDASWLRGFAFPRATVKATAVTCRVRNPACTITKRLWRRRRYINGVSTPDANLCSLWRYTNLLIIIDNFLEKVRRFVRARGWNAGKMTDKYLRCWWNNEDSNDRRKNLWIELSLPGNRILLISNSCPLLFFLRLSEFFIH